ncbi:hypothetical protein [Neisseria sicca]|nr:hypothetical protein [Neisseria sicca]
MLLHKRSSETGFQTTFLCFCAAVYSSGARKVSWQDLQLAPVSL